MTLQQISLDVNEEEKTPREKKQTTFCRCCSSDEFEIAQDGVCVRCLNEF